MIGQHETGKMPGRHILSIFGQVSRAICQASRVVNGNALPGKALCRGTVGFGRVAQALG